MKRLASLALLAFLALGAAPAAAQGCGTANPNCVVPTAPPGTSNNQAASTAFVSGGNGYFNSGFPWCDVRSQGAKGDQVTNDTAAFNACGTVLASIGGTLFVPPGNYCLNGGFSITGTVPIQIVGTGYNTQLQTCGADVNLLTLNNARHQLRDIVLSGSKTLNGTHPTLTLGSGCVECRLDHVLAVGGSNVLFNQGTDVSLNDVNFTQAYGGAIVLNQGAPGGTAQFWGRRVKADQAWPVQTPAMVSSYAAWAANTGYAKGAVVSTGGYLIQANNAGTSLNGAAPTLQPYNVFITDNIGAGSCPGTPNSGICWLLVNQTTYTSIDIDTRSFAVTIKDADMTGSFTYGMRLHNSLAGVAPQSTVLTDSYVGTVQSEGIRFESGAAGLTVKGTQIQSCVLTNCVGIDLLGSDSIIEANFLMANPFGITINAGINHTLANNNIFGSTGAGIFVQCAGPPTRFTITGNKLGSSATWGANTIGIQLAAGACNNFVVENNVTTGAGTELTDGSTGADKYVDITPWAVFPAGTPNLQCGTATFTVNSARYKQMKKTTWAQIDYTITAIGTCVAPVTFTLPNTANSSGSLSGQDLQNGINGTFCTVAAGSAVATCRKNANVAFAVNDNIVVSGPYENQ